MDMKSEGEEKNENPITSYIRVQWKSSSCTFNVILSTTGRKSPRQFDFRPKRQKKKEKKKRETTIMTTTYSVIYVRKFWATDSVCFVFFFFAKVLGATQLMPDVWLCTVCVYQTFVILTRSSLQTSILFSFSFFSSLPSVFFLFQLFIFLIHIYIYKVNVSFHVPTERLEGRRDVCAKRVRDPLAGGRAPREEESFEKTNTTNIGN